MIRALVIIVALASIAVVLWSSWRLDRRLFAGALVLVIIGGTLFGIGVWQSTEEEWRELDTQQLSLEITGARGMEAGIRLQGRIENHSGQGLSRIQAQVERLDCRNGNDCRVVARAPLELREHVASGGTQRWAAMIRMPSSALEDGNDWAVHMEQALGYTGREGERLDRL